MSVMDILSQYLNPTPSAAATSEAHFDEVSRSLSPGELGRGVSETLRADETPPFGDMVSQMFGRSDPHQQAGLLNQILSSLGPAAVAALGGGVLGRIFGSGHDAAAGAVPTVTPDQASRLSPDDVRDIAAQAEKKNPGVIDTVGSFYAQHPDLVKGIGAMGLAVLLGKLAKR